MLKEVFIEKDQSAWWLTALDYLDWSLEPVATPDRIDEATTAQDSGGVDHAKVYEAVRASFLDENNCEVGIEPVAGSYKLDTSDNTVSFMYCVGEEKITIKTVPTSRSSEAGIEIYKLTDSNEEKNICIPTRHNTHDETIVTDLKSAGYVSHYEGEYNRLTVTFTRDSKTGDLVGLSRRDAAVIYCYFKAVANGESNWTVIAPYADISILKPPPDTPPRAKVIALHIV